MCGQFTLFTGECRVGRKVDTGLYPDRPCATVRRDFGHRGGNARHKSVGSREIIPDVERIEDAAFDYIGIGVLGRGRIEARNIDLHGHPQRFRRITPGGCLYR